MTLAKILSQKFNKTIQIFMVAFAVLMATALMPAPAQAAGLTQSQIQAIVSLLNSFGADPAVVANVSHDLGGTSSGSTTTPSIVITAPNSGESYNLGDLLVVRMLAGNMPSDNQLCVYLVNASGRHFVFPDNGDCSTGGGNGEAAFSGTLRRTSGYDLAPGAYTIKAQVLGADPGNGRDRPILAEDVSDGAITIVAAHVPSPTVLASYTSPVGGHIRVGDGIWVTGTGFTAGSSNSVYFDDTLVASNLIPTDNGGGYQYVQFTAPNMQLSAGSHNLTVRNSSGTSNALSFIADNSSVTVLSPNGAEQLVNSPTRNSGVITTITWSTTGLTTSEPMMIHLWDTTGFHGKVLATNVSNTGSFVWRYDPTLANGRYKVDVYSSRLGPGADDMSNNFFTVIKETPIFTITPTSGAAPLVVTASVTDGSTNPSGATVCNQSAVRVGTVAWGDGSAVTVLYSSTCSLSASAQHKYPSAGSFVVTFTDSSGRITTKAVSVGTGSTAAPGTAPAPTPAPAPGVSIGGPASYDMAAAITAFTNSLVAAVIVAPFTLVTDSLGEIFYNLGIY